jgi:hypothetical protein
MLEINAKNFNKAMACEISPWRIFMLKFNLTNNSGVFQVRYEGYNYYYMLQMPNGKRKQMKLVHRLSSYR